MLNRMTVSNLIIKHKICTKNKEEKIRGLRLDLNKKISLNLSSFLELNGRD